MRKLTLPFLIAFALFLYVPAAAAQGTVPAKPALPDAPKPQTAPAAPSPSTPPTPAVSTGAFKDQKEKVSYALGLSLGVNLRRQDMEVDLAELERGMRDGFSGGKALMTEDEVRATLMQMQNDMKARREEKARLAAEKAKEEARLAGTKNKEEGEAFLEANKSKPGVVVLPSGLQYKVLTEGTGPKPAATDTVFCNYRGTLLNGTEFDSSYKTGKPASFPVNRVIPGWTEALQLMPVGSKWQLFIPSALAYRESGAGADIGPNATLIFEVELVSIQPKPESAPPPKP